ncbi:MAG TPA: serine hydrolase domain-containing protein [Gemmatimonadaceae bacterium]|jgi:CubicO group peptidase (beta-lactamase class C family)|nr:serine hydrolase domain-containing protein [Gemmatimonadaceae bacterium]
MLLCAQFRRALSISVAAASTAFAATSAAQAASRSVPDSVAAKIDAVYDRYSGADAPGCAVGVFQNGRIAFEKGYGSANIEYGVPITPTSPFIMGSVSKQFTAAAIALLVEDGRLRLDDEVHKYVPELRDYGKPITIDQLVHHTSGIRDFWTLVQTADMRNDDGYAVDDILRLASRQRHLNFDPGAEYNYSNTGYVLLGVIVRRVSGKSLRQFADERIFGPLGMTHSHFHDDHNEPVPGRVIAYDPAPSGSRGPWKIDVWANDVVGQGGLMTTVEDLQKWDENFYTGTVGGPAFLARQLQQGVLNDGTRLAYAFGLEVGEYRGLRLVEHSGSTGGYRTDIARFPERHTTVATMCNVSTADTPALAHAVADAVLAGAFTKPKPAPARANAAARAAAAQQGAAPTLTDADLDALAGRYYSDELDAMFTIARSGRSLMLYRARSAPEPLRAVAAQTFRAGGLLLHFEGAGSGASDSSFTVDAGRARGIDFTRVK